MDLARELVEAVPVVLIEVSDDDGTQPQKAVCAENGGELVLRHLCLALIYTAVDDSQLAATWLTQAGTAKDGAGSIADINDRYAGHGVKISRWL